MSERSDPFLLTYHGRRTSWLQRVLLATLGVGLAIAAFFFLAIALVAGAFLALAIGVRVWWVMRKLRAQAQASAALEGEYTVVDRAPAERGLER